MVQRIASAVRLKVLAKRSNQFIQAVFLLGLCLGWKGQWICCVTRGREGGIGGEGREVGSEGGREGLREGGREVGGGDGGREGREGGRKEGEREGGMTVIHILIGMSNSNPMTPQYLNNNLT